MRFLEIVFLASLVVSGAALFIAPSRRPAFLRYRPALPVTLALVHVFIDHGRWQLFAAYALAGLISLAAIFEVRDGEGVAKDRPVVRWLGGLVILAVTGISIAAAWLVPLFQLPEPSGSYKVASRWLYLVDSSRIETLAPSPGGKRAVVVRIWHPADSVAGAASDYIESEVAKAMARSLGLPAFALSHLPNITTHSYPRGWLPAKPARFPLLLFSHGYAAGTESQNTVQMEELASHGFVVASIDHPYEAGGVIVPPDSKLLESNPPVPTADSAQARQVKALFDRLRVARDTTEILAPLSELLTMGAAFDTAADRWLVDTRFVLDQITRMSAAHEGNDTLFVGRLVTDSIGIFGMSFGGATAANFCTVDPRCVAGMNLDGLHYGIASRQPLPRPFFIASSQVNPNVHRLFYERAKAQAWLMVTKGAEHMDFTDLGWFAPTLGTKAKMLGGIPASRMHALMNSIVRSWFDAALRGGAPIDPKALAATFPEIMIEHRDGRPPFAPSAADSAKR